MIGNRFLYYRTYQGFYYDKRNNNLDVNSIAFIEETMQIWTHDHFYDGFTGYDVVKMLELLDGSNLQLKTYYSEEIKEPSDEYWTVKTNDSIQTAIKKVEYHTQTVDKDLKEKLVSEDNFDLTKEYNTEKERWEMKFNDWLPGQHFNRYGRIILRPTLDSVGQNYLSQDQFTQRNTIYEIKHDFSLKGSTIKMPPGCAIFLNGGVLSYGKIQGDHTFIFGYNNKNKFIGIESSLDLTDCFNLDGTRYNSISYGPSGLRPLDELAGFTYYDTTLKRLLIWEPNYMNGDGEYEAAWVDANGIKAGTPVQGNDPKDLGYNVNTIKQGFVYKDLSGSWKERHGDPQQRWMVFNGTDWDVLANTDVATYELDGLLSATDKLWIDEAKERLTNLEMEVATLRADFIDKNTFLTNASFTDLLSDWDVFGENDNGTTIRDEEGNIIHQGVVGKKFFRYGNKIFVQAYKKPLTDHYGVTYAIRKDGRASACINNHFIRQTYETYSKNSAYPGAPEPVNNIVNPLSCKLEFWYYVEEPGYLSIHFDHETEANLGKRVIPYDNQRLNVKNLYIEKTKDFERFKKDFLWNGYGDFRISFSGKMYIHTVNIWEDSLLTLKNQYQLVGANVMGVTSRFGGFIDNVDSVVDTQASATIINPDTTDIVYCRDRYAFIAKTTLNGRDCYVSHWVNSILYNDETKNPPTALFDKLFIYKNTIYVNDVQGGGIIEYFIQDKDQYLKNHLVNVDEQGFFVCDREGNVAFKVDHTGVDCINLNIQGIPIDNMLGMFGGGPSFNSMTSLNNDDLL